MATKKKRQQKDNQRSLKNISIKEFITSYSFRIDLDADYQREVIWSRKDQERLLDSILKEIDIPKIYLVEVKDNETYDYECIDGKQRMTTLLKFFKPDTIDEALTVTVVNRKYTYDLLKKTHPNLAKNIEDYELSFVIYKPFDEDGEFVREIFRRLQLGVRLNSGELLKTRTGTIKEFIYNEIGKDGPFFRNTNLSEKRFSRPFTLAQICLNSFSKAETGEFIRARYDDLADFFEAKQKLDKKDKNLIRIKDVLNKMDKSFGKTAVSISSRAIAVTGYLFSEELVVTGKNQQLTEFAKFYIKLLGEIKTNMELLSDFEKPKNPFIMEEFQKYVLQASVEGYSIKRRHEFLKTAFEYYQSSKTKGKIIDKEP